MRKAITFALSPILILLGTFLPAQAQTPNMLSRWLCINEVQVANLDMFLDPSFNYGSWIELHNTSATECTIAGLYVSDDAEDLCKFCLPPETNAIPGKGFKVLWFDHNGPWNLGEHLQIPFKLNYEGGTIILSNGTRIILQLDYPPAVARTSYARTTDGGKDWGLTANPTPGTSNQRSTFASEPLQAPTIDTDSRLFNGTLSVSVTIPSGTTLRYTTDGSTPTLANGQTSESGTFSFTSTTCLRLRLFAEGKLPSPVVTRTYIRKEHNYALPIVAVTGSKANLFGSSYGVFTRGNGNGRPGLGQTSACNWNMEWDRPVNFEYLVPDENGNYHMAFNQEVDLARCGGWSRAWKPYSFKLKASKLYYGLNTLDYPFFPEKPYIRNKTLQLRNGGNDNTCRIKDAALQEIISRSGLNVDGQRWVPVAHFVNGEYRGVINMREPNNKHFALANYGIDTDQMDQFEINPDSNYVQMVGTRDAWDRLYALSKNAADSSTFNEIRQLLDIDELVNYMSVELFLGGNDWPQNNVKGFRSTNDGRFRFVLFDLDHAFNLGSESFTVFRSKKNVTFTTRHGQFWDGTSIEGTSVRGELQFVTIFINLLKNAEFNKLFLDHFCVIAGSVFEPTRCKEIIRQMAKQMEAPMSIANYYDGGTSPWNTANTLINNLTQSRINTMVAAAATFTSTKARRQHVTLRSNIDGATLLVNDFAIPTGYTNTYLYPPFTLTAAPLPGYRFVAWKDQSGDIVSHQPAFSPNEGVTLDLTATYEADEVSTTQPIRINEVSASNATFVNDYFKRDDWIELYNTTSDTLNLAGMFLSDNPAQPQKWQITGAPAQTLIAPHGHRIVWASKRADQGNELHANFKLSNADDQQVIITSAGGEWSDTLTYSTHDPQHTVGRWPDGANNIYLMQHPTIAHSNQLTTFAQLLYGEADHASSINGLLTSQPATVIRTEYFNLSGMRVSSDRQHLAPGIYIVRHTMDNGTIQSNKIIIRTE